MIKHLTSLRGIAIILIILFHLCPQYFPYGYFGVEVFLVISGYLLMKSYLKSNIDFNLLRFARKKILRLFFPVSVTVLITIIAGIYYLDFTDLSAACKTGVYILLGNANTHLAKTQADYFAQDSTGNPFLHMWYLAVTVHIYILFALGCVLYRFVPKRILGILLWMIGIGTLLWAYSYPIHNLLQTLGLPVWEQVRSVSHYQTLPRLWEPLAGILLAIYPPHLNSTSYKITTKSNLLTLLGILCFIVPALSQGENVSLCSAVVVFGTCLVIRYADTSTWARFLNNRVILWVGTISFSLYLVHMPLIAFYNSYFLQSPNLTDSLAIILLSFATGYIFYLIIETRKVNLLIFVIIYIFTFCACAIGRKTNGFKEYFNLETNNVDYPVLNYACESTSPDIYSSFNKNVLLFSRSNFFAFVNKNNFQGSAEPCLIQMGVPSSHPSIVLLGDSHAAASFPGLDNLCKEMNISGIYLNPLIFPFWNWELPALEVDKTYYCNKNKIEALLTWLKEHQEIKYVIISQHWQGRYNSQDQLNWDLQPISISTNSYKESLKNFILKINSTGKQVILLSPTLVIEQRNVGKFVRTYQRLGTYPKNKFNSLLCSRQKYITDNKDVLPILEQLQSEGTCHVLHTLEYIPKEKPFCAFENGEILYKDTDHMSCTGSIKLFRFLKPQLEKILKEKQDQPIPKLD